jgi:hypothetical protein
MSIEQDLLFGEVQVYGYTDTILGSRQVLKSEFLETRLTKKRQGAEMTRQMIPKG